MSPITHMSRAVASFRPSAMPLLSRAHYRRELWAWTMLPVALAAVEGGVTGVIARNCFEGAVSDGLLNFAVAVLAGAPAISNIVSFLWSAVAHGRDKIRTTNVLQVATLVMIALIALAPFNALGLVMLVMGAVGARVCWSGVTILRSTVWRANYPRSIRATLAGKLATVQSLVLAGTASIIGFAMDADENAIRIVYPAAALVGGGGALIYRRLRMRGHRALLNAERDNRSEGGASFNPIHVHRVLRRDPAFRQYMLWMFIFGFGNLATSAPLIIILREHFQLRQMSSVLITATIPLLLMPVSIPIWSRLLDRTHIIHFRATHSWTFVLSTLCITLGAVLGQVWLLVIGAMIKGIAFGGGVLGWNLGHHDFAPPEQASQYMGVHVTLTGIRGVLAPLMAVGIYEWLEAWRPGTGGWTFAVCLMFSFIGALGFLRMARTTTIERSDRVVESTLQQNRVATEDTLSPRG
ncbi:MAG: MFS transporter [Phycisphaerales bacterium]